MPQPNPEQTASLLSLAFYSHLDSLILLAYRLPHLAHSQLPPLADYDHAKNLTKKAFSVCFTCASVFSLHDYIDICSTWILLEAPKDGISSST